MSLQANVIHGKGDIALSKDLTPFPKTPQLN